MVTDLSKKLWFAYVVALFVWGLCAYVQLGKYQYQGELFAYRRDEGPYTNDFVNLYSAGQLARTCLTGTKVDVYDIKVQEASVRELTKPVVPELPFYFQYPPYTFVLALPLVFLPILGAWLAWDIIGLGLSAAALWMVTRETFESPFKRVFAMTGIFSAMPMWVSVWLGQPALFACAGITMFFLAVRDRRPYLAALCTIPVLVKMQYLPLIGLIGLIMLGVPYALTVAGILAVLVLLSVAVLGADNVRAFPHALSQETATAVSGVAAEVMQNLRGFLTLVLPQSPDIVRTVSIVAYLVATVALAYLWFSMKRREILENKDAFAYAASITTLMMLITSLHTHRQDYILLAAPCIWLYMLHTKYGSPWAGKIARILLVSFPFCSWLYFILHPLFAMIYIQAFFAWAVALFAVSIINLRSPVDALPRSEKIPPPPAPG